MRLLLARWWVTLAAALFLLGYVGWWRVFPDSLTRLFQSLPSDQGLYLYVDLEGLRNAPSLQSLLGSDGGPLGTYRAMFGDVGFLDGPAADSLALSMSGDYARVVVHGGISQSQVRTYVIEHGGACQASGAQEICRFKAGNPSRELVLAMLDRDLLSVSYAATPEDASFADDNNEDARDLAPLLRSQVLDGALLWCALEPSRIEDISKALPPGTLNLTFFARALQNADRAYLSVEQEDTPGSFSLRLEAHSSSTEKAAELSELLFGLSRLGAAAADAGRRDTPSQWGQVLRSGEFAQTEAVVAAIWSLDPVL